MNSEAPDPARIDELLDDKLAPAERADTIAQLLQNPELYEQFVIASRTKLDLESATRGKEDEPRIRWRVWIPVAAAAVLGGLLLVPQLTTDTRGPLSLLNPVEMSSSIRVGTPWVASGWEMRGGEPTLPIDRGTRDFRTGVRIVDLEVALTAGDARSANLVGSEIATLLRTREGGAPLAARVERLLPTAGQNVAPPSSQDALTAIAQEIRESSETTTIMFDAGVLLEQARLAAHANNAAFFNDDATREELQTLISNIEENSPTSPLLTSLRSLADQTASASTNLQDVSRYLDSVVSETGRGGVQ